jgi:hypothetical protein
MKFPLSLKSRRLLKIGAFVLVSAGEAPACGPDFPNRYLDLPAQTIVSAPEGFFAVEIARLAPSAKRQVSCENPAGDTREFDDLRAALLQRGDSSSSAKKLIEEFQCYRTKQKKRAEGGPRTKLEATPRGLPAEFAHYSAGAGAWYENDLETAQTEWRAVLALPESERHYRSTWAAYMLARSMEDGFPPNEAQQWLIKTRDLARAGFADSLNLEGASYGIEAHWAMALQDYGRAICLYLDQYETGDESAYQSLRMAAAAAATSDEQQKCEIAREPRARRVLTAWFLARFGSSYDAEPDMVPLRAWTVALARERIHDVEHADRLAWLAYEAGDFDLARTWASLALDASAETHWIRAKLALHDNRLCEGATELNRAAALPDLAAIYRSTVLGELGRVQLALDRREAALTSWLDGAHWEDAAYVAERLLTIDELKAFQARYRPVGRPLYEPYTGERITPQSLGTGEEARDGLRYDAPSSLPTDLAELLARRLVRSGRVEEAKGYFCTKNQALLASYVTDVRAGFNLMLPLKKRAAAFWRAAQLTREEGMVLMGAELEPDFAIWGGSFSNYGAADERLKLTAGPFSVTKAESERLASITIPTKRFSYRYRAADLAWWAASLLPNDSDETATILNTAGGWLKSQDPVEANRFYQALVIRCGRTQLGKAAAERHWFATEM